MIFLSHSWTNKLEARKLVEVFARERLPCWLDEQQLDDGATLRTSLLTAIAQSDVFLYLVSSAANESKWVQEELKYALGLELDEKLCVVPVGLANSQDPLPALLHGRIYSTLDPESGGATRLAQKLSEIEGCDHVANNCQLSTTVRIDGQRLIHTLAESRELLGSRLINVKMLLLNAGYEAVDSLYYSQLCIHFL